MRELLAGGIGLVMIGFYVAILIKAYIDGIEISNPSEFI